MINVSNLFKEELNNGNRNFLAYADITLKDNTVLKLDPSDIWSNGLGNEENVSSPSSFDIGSAIINKCTLVINNIYDKYSKYDFEEAKVHLSVGLKLSNETIEKVNLGYFNVNEPKYNGALITLECLDDMAKFDKKYSESTLMYPATLLQIVQDACSKCNVVCGIADFENGDYIVEERPSDEALTFRQVLAWVGQIACMWFKIDKLGKLSCGWYETQTTENTHVISSISTMSVCTDDVVITGVQVTEYNTNPEEQSNSYKEGTDGYVLSIQNNKLINKGSAQEIAQMIGRKVIGLRFRPMNISFQSNPTIEAGDNVNIVDYKGKTFKTFVTGNRFTVGSLQSIECGAKSPQRNSADRFSQLAQDYIEAQKEIIKEKTEREKAIENLQQTLGDSSGMFITEEKQPDGSTITYIHDKPTKEESKNVIKVTSEAIGISNDGGKTYPYGLFLTGDIIARLLYAVGIDADYIRAGILSDKTGKNFWDLETGEFNMSSTSLIVDGSTLDDLIDSFKLEIHKNHPSMQNYDPNTQEYTPDYITEPLVLSPSTELGGHSVTSEYVWKRIENGQEVDLVSWEVVGSTGILTINKNFESKQRTYICYATYNDGTKNFVDKKIIEFNKTDDGMNGTSGKPGADGKPGKDAAIQSPTEPADKTQLWLDTSVDPPLLKQWNGEEWVIVNDTTGEIESLRTEMQKEIGTTADGIKLEVAKNYYTKGEAEQLQAHIGTQLEQTAKDFLFKFNEYNKELNEIEGNMNSEFQKISEYIRFFNGNIEMGAVGNEFKQLITRTKNSFMQNGVEIAYFGNRKMYVTDGEFVNSLQIGNFGFIPEDNGSLSFRKVR